MPETPIGGNGVMQGKTFKPTPQFNYVCGVNEGWTRQVAFVKDADSMVPNYFVIADSFAAPAPATWRLRLTASRVTPAGNRALVEGKEDVDTDIFFTRPRGIALTTEDRTRRSGPGLFLNMSWGPLATTQTGLIARLERERGVMVVVYPRLKSEKPPVATPIADGKGVKVETSAGLDHVFLSATPFSYKEGNIVFEGTAGLIQQRGKTPVLMLGDAGRLSLGDRKIEEGKVESPSLNVFSDGDFESGKQTVFPEDVANVKVALHKGNPLPNDATKVGEWCAGVTLETNRAFIRIPRNVYVDPSKTYRVSMKVFTNKKITGTFGGYAVSTKGGQCTMPDGAGTWAWAFPMYGPTQGWQTLETTIGPANSDAKLKWPNDVLYTWIHMHFSGERGTVYFDDVAFEEIEQ